MGDQWGATLIGVAFVGLWVGSWVAEKRLSMATRHRIATLSLICCAFTVLPAMVLWGVARLLPPGAASTTVSTLVVILGTLAGLGAVGYMVFYLPHFSRRRFHAGELVAKEIYSEISDAGVEKIIRVAGPEDAAIALETRDQLLGRVTALRHIVRFSYRHGFISKTAIDILADETIEEVLNRTTSENEAHNHFLTSYVHEMRVQQDDLRK